MNVSGELDAPAALS